MKTYTYDVKTKKGQEFIDVTYIVQDAIRKSNMICGQVILFCPHTTAGLTINENADPDVAYDMIKTLNGIYPVDGDYRHFEGNSHAHIKSSLMGVSLTLLVEDQTLLLGTWQSPYFCEFDGPRSRKLIVRLEGVYSE